MQMAYQTIPSTSTAHLIPSTSKVPAGNYRTIPSSLPLPNTVAYWTFSGELNADIPDLTGRGNTLARNMIPAVSTLTFTMGANEAFGQPVTGRIAKPGIWHRLLTPAEKTALAAAEGWPFSTTTSLVDAKAFYLFTEATASVSFADATGRGNTLAKAAGGDIVRAAGPLGTDFSIQLDGTNSLSRAITADLQGGNQSHSIHMLVRLSAFGVTQQFFWGQFNALTRLGDAVYYHAAHDRFQIDLGNDIDLYRNAVVITDTFGAVSLDTWYSLLHEYDQPNNTLRMTINNVASDALSPIQQPDRVTALVAGGYGAKFQVNPDSIALDASGWDAVGSRGYVSRAANADLSFGNNAKVVFGWVQFDDFTTTQTVMGFYDATGNIIDWVLQQSAGVFYFVFGNSAGAFDFISAPIADTDKHLVVAWFDKVGNTINLAVDNVVATPVARTVTPATNSLTFLIGAAHNGANYTQQLKGTLDQWGIADGVPTQAMLDHLWNGGNGL